MAKHETRQVVTLYGERGWHDPATSDYNYGSVNRGYSSMNSYINSLGKHITIHSVSFSHIVFPDPDVPNPSNVKTYRIFAEIVYSGTCNFFSILGHVDEETGQEYRKDNTVFHVYL